MKFPSVLERWRQAARPDARAEYLTHGFVEPVVRLAHRNGNLVQDAEARVIVDRLHRAGMWMTEAGTWTVMELGEPAPNPWGDGYHQPWEWPRDASGTRRETTGLSLNQAVSIMADLELMQSDRLIRTKVGNHDCLAAARVAAGRHFSDAPGAPPVRPPYLRNPIPTSEPGA